MSYFSGFEGALRAWGLIAIVVVVGIALWIWA